MRKAYLLLLFLLPIMGFAQLKDSVLLKFPMDNVGNVVYQEVVTTKLTKEQLFKNAQTWIAKNYGDYKSVIQVQDLSTGNLVFKGKSVYDTYLGRVTDGLTYTVQIEVKPDKFRVKIMGIKEYSTLTSDGSETSTSLAEWYNKQIVRTDEYANNVPSLLREKDNRVKSLLNDIKSSLLENDDF